MNPQTFLKSRRLGTRMSIETRVIGKISAELEMIYKFAKDLRDSPLNDLERSQLTLRLVDTISVSLNGLRAFISACELSSPSSDKQDTTDFVKTFFKRMEQLNGTDEKPTP